MLLFRNSDNGHVKVISSPWVCVALFGSLYFLCKGVWRHAVISFVLSLITVGFSYFVYIFFANRIIRDHYLKNGWHEIGHLPAPGGVEHNHSVPWLWALLWAPLYFAYKRIWLHALASLTLGVFISSLTSIPYTLFAGNILYAFFAGTIVVRHHEVLGWRKAGSGEASGES